MASKDAPHGTPARYRAGCRCSACRDWKADAQAKYRANKAKRDGKPAPKPRPRSDVPTAPDVTTPARIDPTADEVDAEFERMARAAEAGPIEREARALLEPLSDDAVTRLRREVVFRAAQIMDDPKRAALFKDSANIVRAFLADHLAATAGKGGEGGDADAIRDFLGSLGSSRGRRNSAAVDDPAKPSA